MRVANSDDEIKTFGSLLKLVWLYMLELPWRHTARNSDNDDSRPLHWAFWVEGWAWTIAGMFLGALVAPSVLQFAGFSDLPFQDWLVIAVALAAGFLVQLVPLLMAFPAVFIGVRMRKRWDIPWWVEFLLSFVGGTIIVFSPLVGVAYGIHLYLNQVGADQRTTTIAFAGSLLVKTFIIPAIWGAIKSRAFKWLLNWLRGGKETKTV